MPDKTDLDRERKAAAARARFEKATLEIASEHRFAPSAESTEIEMMEEATRLVRETFRGE